MSAEATTASARATGSGASAALRERRLLAVARGAAATALFGTFVVPTLTNVAAFVLLASFLFLPSAGQRLRLVLAQPLARAAIVLLAVLAVATLWSDADMARRFRAWWDWRPLLLLIFCMAVFDEAAARRRALLAFVAMAVIGAGYSWWAWSVGISTVSNNHSMTGIVLRNPVTQGMAFALAAYFSLMLAVTQRQFDRRWRFALAAASAFLVANLIFVTSGRSAHVLLLILLALTALHGLHGWRRASAIVALPVIAIAAFSVSPMLQTRFGLLVEEMRAPLASAQLSAMGIRWAMWHVSGKMLVEQPLLGYGTGGFASAYKRAVQSSSYTGWAATPTEDPHNQFLQVQLQAGIAGSAAFAWFLVAGFRQRAAPPYRLWASGILLGWCVTSLASSYFTTFSESHMLMLLLGVLLAPTRSRSVAAEAAGA